MNLKYDHLLTFQAIPVGTEAIQSFIIENGQKNPKWIVEQKPDIDTTCNAFSVKKLITKHNKHEIIVKYHPTQPNQFHVNYYLIKNLTSHDQILRVSGECEGLSVQISVKYLNFYRLQQEKKTKSTFEVCNKSKCKIKFQFDIDNSQDIFTVEPECGEILPGKCTYVTVQFKTNNNGIFFLDLPCFILYHQPIFIELVGVNAPNETDSYLKTRRGQNLRISLEDGYSKYLNEYFGDNISKPAFIFSNNYLQFSLSSPVNFIDVLNCTDKCLKIFWDTDMEQVFSANPINFTVNSGQRRALEIKFNPTILERLYGAIIYGRAIIYEVKNEKDMKNNVYPISLRLIGNSFLKTNAWIPDVEVFPKVISMPTCIPNVRVYSTFFIQRNGNLPVTYKFLRPSKSRFLVKPSLGIISNPFQIFVLQFSSKCITNAVIEEKWRVELNQAGFMEIIFRASVQQLKIVVGDENKIVFGTIFPGCKEYLKVPIVNLTQNTIKFTFTNNKWFSVEPLEGILKCYESFETKWCFQADCDVPDLCQILYKLCALQDKNVITESSVLSTVDIYAKCSYGKLCAVPNSFDFHSISCGEFYTTSFTLFNFSPAKISFTLNVYEHFGLSQENTLPVKIHPEKATLASGEHLVVTVEVMTYFSCLSTYCVRYSIRKTEDGDEEVEDIGPSFSSQAVIFRIDYFSFYPTLKIIEISRNTTGPLFGKLNIWEYFEMERFNELLRVIRADETYRYHVRVPDAEIDLSISKMIIFIIKNVTQLGTTCRFVRKRICDCQLKEVTSGKGVGSIRKYSYADCPHREILSVSIHDEEIDAYSTTFITIDINYKMGGEQEVCYLMHLSHNRTIELHFQVIGLKLAQFSTYHLGFNLNMHTVYIGELLPDQQIFWFLNNTRGSGKYILDVTPLEKLNEEAGYEILKCLNPTGTIKAKSNHCIHFHFSPISVRRIQLQLPFNFNGENRILNIKGEGALYYTSPLDQLYFTELGKDYHKATGLLVNISTENIVIRGIPTFCSTTRLFTLRNISPGRHIAFVFDPIQNEKIDNISVVPSSGILEPNELMIFFMRIETFGTPCALRECLTCHLIDHTTLKEHLDSTAAYYKQVNDLNDFFQIGSDGQETYAKASSLQITPAPKVFHRTIAVSLHIIPPVDLDIKLGLQDQLKQTPFYDVAFSEPDLVVEKLLVPRINITELSIRSSHTEQEKLEKILNKQDCVEINTDEYVAVHTVLSCLLRDIVYSKLFKHEVTAASEHNDKYYCNDIRTDFSSVEEEKNMTELMVKQIPMWFLSNVLQTVLGDCVVQQFKLGTYPHDLKCCNSEEKSYVKDTYGSAWYTDKFSFLLDYL